MQCMASVRRHGLVLGFGVLGCGSPRGEEMTTLAAGTASAGDDGTSTGAAAVDTTAAAILDVAADSGSGPAGDEGTNMCQQDIDIVFVMDVSTSMGPFLGKLADEILVVDQAIADLGLPNPPHYGLVVFVDDAAILNTGAPYADVQTLRSDFQQWSAFTSTNSQVSGGGSNSTWPENSLDALFLAGAGFQWRAEGDATLRMIIHTTDDTFWNGPTTADGVSIMHGYDEVVGALQDRQIRVFSFAAQIGGSCECEDVTPGWSSPYMGQTPLPEATDGEVYDIDLVLANQLSLSAAIGEAITVSMCDPYTPVG